MAKYRYKDKQEVNEHGQTLGYAIWFGGPSLTYVGDVVCQDGVKANFFASGDPECLGNFYQVTPGYVHRSGKRIKGELYRFDDGPYRFR
jgi:hypothetical protein